MIRCLEDKTLFLLSEGEAGEEQRSHLQSCQACTERYHEIERDLRLITQTLQQRPPSLRSEPRALSDFCPSPPEFSWPSRLCGARAGFGAPTRHRNKDLAAMSLNFWSRFRTRSSMAAAWEKLSPPRPILISPRCRSPWGKIAPTSAGGFSMRRLQQIPKQK